MKIKLLVALLMLGFLTFFTLAQAKNEKDSLRVLMKTTKGNILIELNAEKAPITVENFLSYVDDGFYDGTIFHRVIKNFMIQGGGFDAELKEKKTKDPIKNEATNGLSNRRGTIAMARTAVVDSATAQFYINHVDNPGLDHKNETNRGFGYAVFGKVVDGMNVVDAIAKAETGPKGPFRQDCPKETIEIISVTRVDAKKADKTE